MEFIVLSVFLISYFGIVLKRDKALFFIYGAVLIFFVLQIINFKDIYNFINYNVLGIFLGTSILSYLFSFSEIPTYIVEKIEEKEYTVGMVYLIICIVTGLISLFVENVATILIISPVALKFTKKYNLNPVPLFIGMAISSNLQGCGTMVGDSPSIILAMETGMNFNDFFYMPAVKIGQETGKLGIFFFVQFGAIISFFVLYLFFRKFKKVYKLEKKIIKIKSFIPLSLLILMIFSLAISSFFYDKFSYFPLIICLFYGIVGIIWYFFSYKEKTFLKHIDWESFFLLLGIFIVIGTIKKVGFIEYIANFLVKIGGKNHFLLYNLIVWLSVFVSAFVDNIPYTMAMISSIKILTNSLNLNPYIYLFGLLIGTCIGGNITPIGASCNVVGIGILKRNGYKVTFQQFFKIGFPFTVTAVLGASLIMWLVYN